MPPLFSSPTNLPTDAWDFSNREGQLTVDVLRDGRRLVIRSFLAGIDPMDLEIMLDGDLLTIRGQRQESTTQNEDDWYYKECYWGSFSRSVVLPVDVYAEQAEAHLHQGVLEIKIPIRDAPRSIPIQMKRKTP